MPPRTTGGGGSVRAFARLFGARLQLQLDFLGLVPDLDLKGSSGRVGVDRRMVYFPVRLGRFDLDLPVFFVPVDLTLSFLEHLPEPLTRVRGPFGVLWWSWDDRHLVLAGLDA